MEHILAALVEDKPGVLNRVASLFRRRVFNIESLTVGHTEQPGISRMTITMDSSQVAVERVIAHLYKLVNVIEVADLSTTAAVARDLALIKVCADTANRANVMQLVDVYRGRVVDVTNDAMMIEVTGTADKIDSCIEVLRPFGIIEMARTGLIAMARGAAPTHTTLAGAAAGNGHAGEQA